MSESVEAHVKMRVQFRELSTARVLVPALLVLAAITFINSIGGDFVYDDLALVRDNRLLGRWDHQALSLLLTKDARSSLRPELAGNGTLSNYYRPVATLFLMGWHGIAQGSPLWWHLASILLHAGATALAFAVLNQSLALFSGYGPSSRRSLAAFGAAVFAVHPVQSESVAWISAFMNPLSAVFILAGTWLYLDARDAGSPGRRRLEVAAAGSFLLFALLTKESAVALLGILAAYEFFLFNRGAPFGEKLLRSSLGLLPFAAVTAAYFGLRYAVLGFFFGRPFANSNYPDDASVTTLHYLSSLPSLALHYIRTAVFPVYISPVYDLSFVRVLTMASFWAPVSLLVAAAIVLLYWSRQSVEARLAAIWMIIPLAPHFNIGTFHSEDLVHDRYLYLSIVGLGLAIGHLIWRAGRDLARAGLAVSVLGVLITLTLTHNLVWHNNETLWFEAVERAPNSRVARLWLGLLAEEQHDLDSAVLHYEAALRINPDIVDALTNLAFVYAKLGRWDQATEKFERVASLLPDDGLSHFNLSVAYAAQKRFRDEFLALKKAIELEPTHPNVDAWRKRLHDLDNLLGPDAARPEVTTDAQS